MQNRTTNRAFTIIELLVVVSIIALLVGILLPAIGKARDQAKLSQSQANVKQLVTAVQTYAAEYADRQPTYCVDNLSTYGQGPNCMPAYWNAHGSVPGVGAHPPTLLGFGWNGTASGTWGYWQWGYSTNQGNYNAANYICAVPCDFESGDKFGAFRIINARNFSTAVSGRFYDPVFYAPKDTAVISTVERAFDDPSEFSNLFVGGPNGEPLWSSYCFSPAAMLNPDVLGRNDSTGAYYTNPWTLAAGFRSPAMSQAAYPDLKTHIIEHHWLQNRRRICSPIFGTGGVYDGCQPDFFNGSRESAPVTAYYDGHVGNRGQRDAIDSNSRVLTQSGHGLWSTTAATWASTNGYNPNSDGGYYMEACIDSTSTSYHMLTIDGIKGRDFLAK